MPPGSGRDGDYRLREVGSVMPCVRLRDAMDPADRPGVITFAVMTEALGAPAERIEEEAERIGNVKNPLGNGWNGWNGSQEVAPSVSVSVPKEGGEGEAERERERT